MAVVYSNTLKAARLQAVIDALGSDAVLVIGSSALAGGSTGVLVTIPLADPPFTISGTAMTLASLPRTGTATATGTASKGELRTSSGTVVVSGLTVGTTTQDFVINATAISVGQTVQATAGTITHG